MGRIYYLMGKSASGKDTIYEILKKDCSLHLQPVVLYTTRPMRSGEVDGVTYHFVDEDSLLKMQEAGHVIESRTYQTVHGPWTYATVDDGQWQLGTQDYLAVGVLESYHNIKAYFGSDRVIPLYIEVEDGERLTRALNREKNQSSPKYEEMCRRFLSDQKDFSEERLREEGITVRYRNRDLNLCVEEILQVIRKGIDSAS